MPGDFAANLKRGQQSELTIRDWLEKQGYAVVPAYEKEPGDFKGPRMFSADGDLVLPDLFACRGGASMWVEAKDKSGFTWHRKTGEWTTGIDERVYLDYLKVAQKSGLPVWLFFLQRGLPTKGSTLASPTGLYGNPIDYLSEHEHHRHDNFNNGRGGVFWSMDALRFLAPLEEFAPALAEVA